MTWRINDRKEARKRLIEILDILGIEHAFIIVTRKENDDVTFTTLHEEIHAYRPNVEITIPLEVLKESLSYT